jgi:hypothetical protein
MPGGWVDPAFRPADQVPGTPEWRARTRAEATTRAFSEAADEQLLDLMALWKRSKRHYADEHYRAARAEVLRRMAVGR